MPSSIGNNAVGTVDAIGLRVDAPYVGDRISLIPSFEMNKYSVYGQYAIVPAYAAAPYTTLEAGALQHNIARQFSLSDVAAAHEAQDSGQLIGKVIVEIV